MTQVPQKHANRKVDILRISIYLDVVLYRHKHCSPPKVETTKSNIVLELIPKIYLSTSKLRVFGNICENCSDFGHTDHDVPNRHHT
jgi:hypothetical protein